MSDDYAMALQRLTHNAALAVTEARRRWAIEQSLKYFAGDTKQIEEMARHIESYAITGRFNQPDNTAAQGGGICTVVGPT